MRASDLQFVNVHAPVNQVVRVRDVEPNVESAWRGGLNKSPASLEAKMVTLLHSELKQNDLELTSHSNAVLLVARKPLREGEVVCRMSGLTYDSLEKLRSFLNNDLTGYNHDLVSAMVRINGVHVGDADPPASASFFHVLTGCGRYVRHYAAHGRKHPNVVMHVDVSSGFNDGLLTLVVKTRNKCGVAPGSALLMNFGMDYDHAAVGAAIGQPDPKRAKGLLDQYFSRLGPAESHGGADGAGPVKPEGAGPEGVRPEGAAAAGVAAAAEGVAAEGADGAGPEGAAADGVAAGSASAEDVAAGPPAAAASGEREVARVTSPFPMKLMFKPPVEGAVATLALETLEELPNNKKLAPKTVLLSHRTGKIESSSGVGVNYGWTSMKTLVHVKSSSSYEFKTLQKFMADSGATAIKRHTYSSSAPTEIQPPSGLKYMFGDDAMSEVYSFCQDLQDISWDWVVKFDEKEKTVKPLGVVLHLKKQIIMPKEGRLIFK